MGNFCPLARPSQKRHCEERLFFSSVIARSGTVKQSIDSAFAINILQMDHRVVSNDTPRNDKKNLKQIFI